ncbi:MAG: carboxypeptidase regulatory-like domain-containing protein [Chloroflexota bacterium]|nr:carboxypeptidase regulatory-like domain-containing protein [Chloroflexota bacterium]
MFITRDALALRRSIIVLTVLLLIVAFGGQSAQAQSSACPASAIQLRPGDNLQQIIDRNPAGSIYCFNDGTYDRASIIPKDNDALIAANAGRAILDGNGATEFAITGTRGPQNPNNSENVVVVGLVIQNYRTGTPTNNGAVDANVGWRVQNNLFRNNDAGLIYARMNWACSQGAIVENNRFENNRFVAFYWNGTQANIAGNTFISNGWAAPSNVASWYGSIKITNQGSWNSSYSRLNPCPTAGGSNRVVVTLNTSAYNRAAGWWNDEDVAGLEMIYNYIVGNEWFGIFHEISGSAMIANNIVECNRSTITGDGFWGGADIAVFSSINTTVQNNTVTVCSPGSQWSAAGISGSVADGGRGIALLAEGITRPGGVRPLNNNRVSNNTIQVRGGSIDYLLGITQYNGSPMSNNTFDNNTFVGVSATQRLWNWFESMSTLSAWQAQGNDRNSTIGIGGATPTLPPSATAVTIQPTNTSVAPTATGIASTATAVAAVPTATPSTSQPYFGAPLPVPGRIQAEDFDRGSQNVAWFDTTSQQEGGALYRTDQTSVDLKANTAGNFTVGWFTDTEWLNYTINVAQAGRYDITLMAGAVDADRQIAITVNGQPVVQSVAIPRIANWDAPLQEVTVRGLQLNAGTQVMRVTNLRGFLDFDYIEITRSAAPTNTPPPVVPTNTSVPTVRPTNTAVPVIPTATPLPAQPTATTVAAQPTFAPGLMPGSDPYYGAPLPLPGRIQAEDFDRGASGIAWWDSTATQDGGTHYRNDQHGVDLKPNADGNFTVGWFIDTEWMNYSVNVPQAGLYDITMRTGAVDAGRLLTLWMNWQPVAQNIPVPQIASWDAPLQTITIRGVQLTAGPQVLRITNVLGFLDLDWIEFTSSMSASATPLPAQPTNTPVPVIPTSTPAPTVPMLRAVPNAASYLPGSAVSVDFVLDLPNIQPGSGVRAIEAMCAVAPAGVVTGQTITAGALFGPAPVTVNTGFRPDGTFTYATSQSGANPAVTTQGTVFTAALAASVEGTAQVSCNVTVINADRSESQLTFTPAVLVVANSPTATFVPPTPMAVQPTGAPPTATFIPTATIVPPTATFIPTATLMPPTATAVPSATPVVPTATPLPTNTPAPTLGSVTGIVRRSANPDSSGITINVLASGAVIGTTTTASDGSFTLSNVAAGNYTIRAEAPGYLPAEGTVTITAGQTAQKTAITLQAGDVVASNPPVIDELDVVLMATSYGTPETSEQLPADVDGNGRIGLGDLTALAENLRAAGPQTWN